MKLTASAILSNLYDKVTAICKTIIIKLTNSALSYQRVKLINTHE